MDIEQPIPVIKGNFLLGSLSEVKKDLLGFMSRVFASKGGLAKFFIGRNSVYLISEPEMVEQVMIKNKDVFVKAYDENKPRGLALVLGNGLVTSRGAFWKKQRRIMQPIFYKSNIATMGETITELGGQAIARLQKHDDTDEVDMAPLMSGLTLEIISQTMFGSSADRLRGRLAGDLDVLMSYAQADFFHPLPWMRHLPTRNNRRFNRALGFLTRSINEMIQRRRSSSERHDDLLDALLNARDEQSGEGMSPQQIVDEALTIYSAGHETTATALTWALYLIASHGEVQQRLQAEIDMQLQGRRPQVADLEQLPYTRAILEESMRLYPPIVLLLRRIGHDIEIQHHRFRKNGYTLVNIYNLHHDPRYWPDAESFQPERFLSPRREQIEKHTYIPFGIGPRVCLGNHFAMMEAMLLLAQLVQAFEFEYTKRQPATPRLAISLRPEGGMPLRLRARKTR